MLNKSTVPPPTHRGRHIWKHPLYESHYLGPPPGLSFLPLLVSFRFHFPAAAAYCEFFSLDQLSFFPSINSTLWWSIELQGECWAPQRAGNRQCHADPEDLFRIHLGKWDNITPNARGIMGFICSKGFLMWPKGQKTKGEGPGSSFKNSRGMKESHRSQEMECNNYSIIWQVRFMKRAIHARYSIFIFWYYLNS